MNILTFDIEDWFHILEHERLSDSRNWDNLEYRLEANSERILGLLENTNHKATFFCLGWIAKKFPKVIKKIDSMNFSIGSHSDLHNVVSCQSKLEFREDLKRSLNSLEEITGKKVTSYRAPGFSISSSSKWALEELASQGITKDASIFAHKRAHGGFKELNCDEPTLIELNGIYIKEFPINLFKFGRTKTVFSGGGYFRLLPYFVINYMFKNSNYVMTYFHPRDFDKKQPKISDLNTLRRFKHYIGLNSSFKKFKFLLKDFNFIDINQADELTNWSKAKRLNLS